jgi:hypothetical protein
MKKQTVNKAVKGGTPMTRLERQFKDFADALAKLLPSDHLNFYAEEANRLIGRVIINESVGERPVRYLPWHAGYGMLPDFKWGVQGIGSPHDVPSQPYTSPVIWATPEFAGYEHIQEQIAKDLEYFLTWRPHPRKYNEERRPPLFVVYSGKDLARQVGTSANTIQAAKNMGFVFTHARKTTEESWWAWLAANPDFRQVQGWQKDKLRRPDFSRPRPPRRAQAQRPSPGEQYFGAPMEPGK